MSIPNIYQGTDISGIDWTGPAVDIVDELVLRRATSHSLSSDTERDLEWAEDVFARYADALDPALVGKV